MKITKTHKSLTRKSRAAYDPLVNRTGAGPQGSEKGGRGYTRKPKHKGKAEW